MTAALGTKIPAMVPFKQRILHKCGLSPFGFAALFSDETVVSILPDFLIEAFVSTAKAQLQVA